MVMHTLKDDPTTSGRQDLVALHLEELPDLELFDLFLEQLLDRLVERLLHLTDTDNVSLVSHAPADDVFSKCVGLS